MIKKSISLALCLILLLAMALPVYAEEGEAQAEAAVAELKLSSPEDLIAFAENCRLDSYSQNLAVTLEKDIDLGGIAFEAIPVFSGSFDGGGHCISGLRIDADGSVQGLFRYLTSTAVVENLSVEGEIQPGGSRNKVAAIAGHNEGRIISCSFSGVLSGADYVGGIAGVNAVSGIIENCRVAGELYGDHFVGGIAGENSGVIRGCFNNAMINTSPQQNSVSISDISLDSLTNTEAANTVTDVGGIAGISSGVIRGCRNKNDVGYQHMGYNIGGIAGTQTGYIVRCENHGSIQGRKEVGGIVGQMEPTSQIEYTEDTLQILRGQLGTMSGLVNQASGNVQANAANVSGQIGLLQDQTQTARDALESLIPNPENPEVPDPDSIIAAQNTLTATLAAMPDTMNGIAYATQTTLYSLTSDLNAISGQISAMGQTLNNASENIGGTITDVSDKDSPELFSGKVQACVNYGRTLGDLNVGGIAGAMAMENDLDILEDWEQRGEESMNFKSEIRAVILDCDNSGPVTGKKQNLGGIVGWQSLGLVKDCTNTGEIDGTNASYVGGISGLSTSYIRSDYAKCEIYGKSCVGGIAGSGSIMTDCISMVQIHNASEKLGAISGELAEGRGREEESPVSGNIYPRLSRDIGAIDAISYSGLAEGMAPDEFFALEGLPDMFRSVRVQFVFPDGSARQIELSPGGSLGADRIPAIAEKDGFTAKWDGLDEAGLDSVVCDLSFDAIYIPHSTSIQSVQSRENGLPLLLAEGSFGENDAVTAEESDAAPELAEKAVLLESWTVCLPEGAETLRLLMPDDTDAGDISILICSDGESWQEAAFRQNGKYLVFPAAAGEMQLAVFKADNSASIILAICLALAALLLAASLYFRHKHKKVKTAA